eukprot:TRINITY_DN3604_c0_g1_i1.p1 TRINITY_DN3604_c0_g1~~TRINITY_DN3604_c0_g1_i1.p1  ORF type:complete len:508 (+),score=194.21 TRINITY_DN3604_c0_g1_i1:173-1525(+)
MGDISKGKKFNVARFTDQKTLDFTKFAEPVKMYSKDSEPEQLVLPSLNPKFKELNKQMRRISMERFFEKRKKEARKKRIESTWHIEDNAGEHVFEGSLEGGQAESRYAILVLEDSTFKVQLVDTWYNFRAQKHYQTLSLEEAEAHLASKSMKFEKKLEKFYKREEGDNTTAEAEAKAVHYPDEDRFTGFDSLENMKKKKADKIKKEKKENGEEGEDAEEEVEAEDMPDEEKGEDMDFEKRVSDDEEEEQAADEDAEDATKTEENEDESEQALSSSGKEMKSLLKNAKKEEEFGSSDEEEEDEDVDDIDIESMNMYAARNTANNEVPPEVSEKKATLPESGKKEVPGDKKRPLPSPGEGPDAKKQKSAPAATANAAPTPDIEEEEVRKILLTSGKIKTKQLVNKFKARLTEPKQKAKFAQIVKKIGEIVEELGEKYLTLKPEYRRGLKAPK